MAGPRSRPYYLQFLSYLVIYHSAVAADPTQKPLTSATVSPSVSTPTVALPSTSTCQSRTINYITHTLPQQCLRPSRAPANGTTATTAALTAVVSVVNSTIPTSASPEGNGTENAGLGAEPSLSDSTTATDTSGLNTMEKAVRPDATASQSSTPTAEHTVSSSATAAADAETDSPLDNANFLSFEEWRKQNLAKAGQSAEHVGQKRNSDHTPETRRRPGNINNALDSLGEDTEIELDFGGFVSDSQESRQTINRPSSQASEIDADAQGRDGASDDVSPSSLRTNYRDAGKTCKERFNYASFDCAATVLKTNPKSKSSTSILVENKDSYMLNECSQDNKFIIVELCDIILVDTVVLANFEFFSSIFRTFRVSVSDRYPAKADKWRDLGTYEARNSREVQPFLIKDPLIWAKYIRIEFLTHFGSEYYCPVSLLRVHGTTMMEEFRHGNEGGRVDEDGEEEGTSESVALSNERVVDVKVTSSTATVEEELSKVEIAPTSVMDGAEAASTIVPASNGSQLRVHATEQSVQVDARAQSPEVSQARSMCRQPTDREEYSSLFRSIYTCHPTETPAPPLKAMGSTSIKPTGDPPSPASSSEGISKSKNTSSSLPSSTSDDRSGREDATIAKSATPTSAEAPPSVPSDRPVSAVKDTASSRQEPSRSQAAANHPPSTAPTTQENFFKTIHKRLQLLESNSTLSLQYIEEQSRILREAFTKVESRQMAKTTRFLETLNVTVLTQLRGYREQYDQIWQSTVIELENQREQSQREIIAVSTRLGILADEVVFQKRMFIVQSLLLLVCIGLVLFSRGAGHGYLELPVVQNMLARSPSNVRLGSESPSRSPSSTRPDSSWEDDGRLRSPRVHLRQPSEESMERRSSPALAFSPPTPTSLDAQSEDEETVDYASPSGDESPQTPLRARGSLHKQSETDSANDACGEDSSLGDDELSLASRDNVNLLQVGSPEKRINGARSTHRRPASHTEDYSATSLGS